MSFDNYIQNKSVVTEGVFAFKTDNIEQLHFETDPKTAEEMKIELGKKQGEVSKRKQIESGEYSLRRFRKEIGYGNGKDVGVFIPGSYDASVSKLGDGPHKKAVKAIKWNQKKYDQWLEDMASNGGAENAFDMAQNAKNEPGLINWVKKEFRGDDPLQRIQWDIEGFAESVDEAFIGPFVFNDRMSDEELKAMYNGALDGYANYSKGFQHSKSDYKQAYQEIEKILKKRGVSVDESLQRIQWDIEGYAESNKTNKTNKTTMKHVKLFEQFITEKFSKKDAKQLIKDLKADGFDASGNENWIQVDGVDSPNSSYDGTVSMAWDPVEKEAYSDDDTYEEPVETVEDFMDILNYPEATMGMWG